MMNDDELRTTLLTTLGLTDVSAEEQDAVLYRVESIAQKRLSLVIPELLTDEQLQEVERKEAAGEDNDTVMDWVLDQIPEYGEMIQAVMQDVAAEMVA